MNDGSILVVDDEPDIRELVQDILEDEGYRVRVAEDGDAARRLYARELPDLVLLDIWMPGIDGISLLKEWMTEEKPVPVVMMSGHGTVETAVEATRLGALDYIEKPLSLGKLLLTVKGALRGRTQSPTTSSDILADLELPVGRSAVNNAVRDRIEQLSGEQSVVLFAGEQGSGRRVWAHYLHSFDHQRQGNFVVAESSWLNRQEALSVLFGDERFGRIVPGLVEKAAGGTLLITEAQQVSPEVLTYLLEIQQYGRYQRQNGQTYIPFKARLVLTSDDDFSLPIKTRQIDRVVVPALREHPSDVPELLSHFVNQLATRERLPFRTFSVAAQNRLRYYAWPGNLREMQNFVRRLLLAGEHGEIGSSEVEQLIENSQQSTLHEQSLEMLFKLPIKEARDHFEKAYLLHHIRVNDGNVSKVSRQAELERTHLYRKMRALGIDIKQEKVKK